MRLELLWKVIGSLRWFLRIEILMGLFIWLRVFGGIVMELPERMRNYVSVEDRRLMIKEPVILWLDGRAFHTFSRGLGKPFSEALMKTMDQVLVEMCQDIQGAKLGYTQSDELSILLTDWESYETQPWFQYRVQKISSSASSMATALFNRIWQDSLSMHEDTAQDLDRFANRTAMFDCKVFNLPFHEVHNWFLWRQLDWIRNSVQMTARSLFSHKELHGLNQAQLKEKIRECGVEWESLPRRCKYGFSSPGEEVVYVGNRDFVRAALGERD